MAGLTRTFPIDTALELEDGAGAITATGVGSTAQIDLGADSVMLGAMVLQVTAIDVANANESYEIELQGTNTSGFGTAADNVVLAHIHLGDQSVTGATPADTGTDTPAAVYYVPFTNDFGGTAYRYVRLKATLAGTTPSITFSAFLTQQRTMGN